MAIKPENKKLYPKNWKEFSKKIIKLRHNHCEICKKMGIKRDIFLTVHHKDRNPANNKLSNLLVCCPRHHFQQERLINKGYFNKKQLELGI